MDAADLAVNLSCKKVCVCKWRFLGIDDSSYAVALSPSLISSYNLRYLNDNGNYAVAFSSNLS